MGVFDNWRGNKNKEIDPNIPASEEEEAEVLNFVEQPEHDDKVIEEQPEDKPAAKSEEALPEDYLDQLAKTPSELEKSDSINQVEEIHDIPDERAMELLDQEFANEIQQIRDSVPEGEDVEAAVNRYRAELLHGFKDVVNQSKAKRIAELEPEVDLPPKTEVEAEQKIEQEIEEAVEEIVSDEDQMRDILKREFAGAFSEIYRTEEPEIADQLVNEALAGMIKKIQGTEAKSKLGSSLRKQAKRFGLDKFGTAFAVTAGLKFVVKNTARAWAGTASMGTSVLIGGALGGLWGYVDALRKDRYKVDESEVMSQLAAAQARGDNVATAAVIDKARQEIKKGQLSPVEANEYKVQLLKAELLLRLDVGKEKLETQDDVGKFLSVVKESSQTRKDLRKLEGVKHEKLEEKIKFKYSNNPEFSRKAAKKVVVGMIAGGLGTAAGHGLHALIDSGYLDSALNKISGLFTGERAAAKVAEKTIEEQPNLVMPKPEPGPTPTPESGLNEVDSSIQESVKGLGIEQTLTPEQLNEVKESVDILQQEVANAKTAETLEHAQVNLLDQKFRSMPYEGEGATHMARVMLHDYLVNKAHLSGSKAEFTEEHLARLIYAEDTLKNSLLDQTTGPDHIVQNTQTFELTGQQIEDIWVKAQQLTPEQLQNIDKMLDSPNHHLSQKTLDFLQTDDLLEKDNNFFQKIAETANQPGVAGDTGVVEMDAETFDAQVEHARNVAVGESFTPSVESGKPKHVDYDKFTALLLTAIIGIPMAKKAYRYTMKKIRGNLERLDNVQNPEVDKAENPEVFRKKEFEVYRADMRADFDVDIYPANAKLLEGSLPYVEKLREVISKNSEYFKGKKIILDDKNGKEVNGIAHYLDLNQDLEGNIEWLEEISKMPEIEEDVKAKAEEEPKVAKTVENENEAEDPEWAEKLQVGQTIVLGKKSKIPVSLERRSEEDAETFFDRKKVEIHGSEWGLRTLTPEDLKNAGLGPERIVKIADSDVQIGLSKVYRIGETRLAATAYVEEDGKFVARSFYRSSTAGGWRYLPAYLKGLDGDLEWYDKAMSEHAETLPSELQEALAYLSHPKADIKVLDDPMFYFAGTAKDLAKIANGEENERTIVFEVKKDGEKIPGIEPNNNSSNKQSPESLKITDSKFAPDFKKGPIARWKQYSKLYAKDGTDEAAIEFEVFESPNELARYVFCFDEQGRAWVFNVEAKSQIGSTGLREKWFDAGDLTTPVYEYSAQSGGYGKAHPTNPNYVDMFDSYQSKMPLIEEYLKHRKSRNAKGKPSKSAEGIGPDEYDEAKVDWAGALAAEQPKEEPELEPAESVVETESVAEVGEPVESAQELPLIERLKTEAVDRNLTKESARSWISIMRPDGGLLNKIVGTLIDADQAEDLRKALRRVGDYALTDDAMSKVEKSRRLKFESDKLAVVYKNIVAPAKLKAQREGVMKDEIDKLIKHLRKLTPKSNDPTEDIIRQAEKIAARRMKTTPEKLFG